MRQELNLLNQILVPDTAGHGRAHNAADDQQPGQVHRAQGLRPRRGGESAGDLTYHQGEREVPRDEENQDGARLRLRPPRQRTGGIHQSRGHQRYPKLINDIIATANSP